MSAWSPPCRGKNGGTIRRMCYQSRGYRARRLSRGGTFWTRLSRVVTWGSFLIRLRESTRPRGSLPQMKIQCASSGAGLLGITLACVAVQAADTEFVTIFDGSSGRAGSPTRKQTPVTSQCPGRRPEPARSGGYIVVHEKPPRRLRPRLRLQALQGLQLGGLPPGRRPEGPGHDGPGDRASTTRPAPGSTTRARSTTWSRPGSTPRSRSASGTT